MKEDLKELIRTFHKKNLDFKRRDINIPFNTNKIITLIGARRVGKTHIFYQLINDLLKNGINIENILYINFEDERFDFNKDNLKLIIDVYQELYPNLKLSDCYFFFDEIQNVDVWETFIRRIYDNYTKNIFITGSSSKLLSGEIATSLRGRSISYEIYPLSFKEFLNFKNINIDIYDEKSKFKIKSEFENYFLNGSYPETLDFNSEIKYKTYQEYLSVMILKDIIDRYNLKNREILNIFIKKTLSSISTEFSINKFYNQLKSEGFNLSKDLLYEFPNYLQDIFLVYFLEKYNFSSMKRSLVSKKVYCNDVGFVNLFKFSEDRGRLLENLIYLELKRKDKKVYYHFGKNECDFVIFDREKIVQAIQVTKSLENIDTKSREIEGLLDACKIYKLKEGLILTEDEDGEQLRELRLENSEILKVKIKIMSIYKWLLDNQL